MLGPILNCKSYTSVDWKDTKIHLGGMNTINILKNTKYDKISQKQFKKVKNLYEPIAKLNVEIISHSAGEFWAYATAWL